MSKFNKIRTSFVNRPIPKRGPFNSDEYNSGQQETAIDVATFATRWNEELYPIFNTLPKGQGDARWPGADSVPDVLVEGLDGSTLLIDNDAPEVDSLEDLFWDKDLQRPRTIKEALFHVDADLAVKYSAISLQLSGVSNGLSSAQWNRLGRAIQDPGQVSASDSLDGKVNGLTD